MGVAFTVRTLALLKWAGCCSQVQNLKQTTIPPAIVHICRLYICILQVLGDIYICFILKLLDRYLNSCCKNEVAVPHTVSV